ncbi:hypothetical protein AR546_14035 [Leptospira interrogans serovar Canicola]|nr:hypothetical protein A6J42_08620 [Leptospira interrogans serovar Copenhageni]ASP42792.1 hypothetical protein AMR47_18620 [Leptospira interrogans]ASV05321.1 hypothetical protein B2G47_03645 [Leptospira interrogans serovar Canicola]KAA1268132.1 hypothetical protein C5473_09080 [Leptospira interrogans serovar Weerasinghe]KAA1291235.1 hypothetical protein C4X99_13450 [Leptospira interrogans serovar Geyaweera]OOB94103.1 hypothetical protein B0191_13610 [Leptospira interrogans serovar Hardjo]OOB
MNDYICHNLMAVMIFITSRGSREFDFDSSYFGKKVSFSRKVLKLTKVLSAYRISYLNES